MTVRIEEWVPGSELDDVARARYDQDVVRAADEWPEDPIEPPDLWLKQIVDQPSYRRPKRWVAWSENGSELVGSAYLGLNYTETNRHLAWFDVYVRPDRRREGIGRELLGYVVDAGRNDGRTVLGANVVAGGPGQAFVKALGMDEKSTERKSRLTVANVDRPMLEDWVARAKERASDYELIGFDNRCPDDMVERWVEVALVMNTAPRDDLDMEDDTDTPERYREREEKALARGMTWWRLVAVHKPTGKWAGFTEFFFPPHTDEVVYQEGTGVDPAHRDKGLGRWLKAANLLRLMDERPNAKYVDTWNAFSNGPMLGINIAMGFEIIRGYTAYQAPTDALAAAVKR